MEQSVGGYDPAKQAQIAYTLALAKLKEAGSGDCENDLAKARLVRVTLSVLRAAMSTEEVAVAALREFGAGRLRNVKVIRTNAPGDA